MRGSHFNNPNGLPDPGQVSTARDIAILCRALVRDFPQYYSLFDTRTFTYRGRTMRNTNHLLGVVPGVDGIKTGFTNAAGHNIAISGVRDGRRVIVVVLGAPSGPSRDVTARALLTTGFQLVARETPGVQLAQAAAEAPVPKVVAEKVVADQTRAEPAPARPAQADSLRWTVLVGGFRARTQAQRFVTQIEHRYRRELRGLQPQVIGHGPFRVEFARLNERQAKSACETLSASGHSCSRVSTGA
jgi:D-alanyl-D-alanine carboxypeptidase (penicillin-binding protein 5/6)